MSSGSQSYSLGTTSGSLAVQMGANGTIDIVDNGNNSVLLQLSSSDGYTYTLTGSGISDTNTYVDGTDTLTFTANVSGGGTTTLSLPVGQQTYGQNPANIPAGVTSHFVDASALSGGAVNVNSLFTGLTSLDWVWVQGNTGGNTITGGGAHELTIVSYELASGSATSLSAVQSGGAILIEDQNSTVEYTITPVSGSTYTVSQGASGPTVGTVTNVNDLHFFVANGSNPPTVVTDVQLGLTYGPAGSHHYWVNGAALSANSIDVATLFPSAAATDTVWVQNDGSADTVTNTTSARVTVEYQLANAGSLSAVWGSGGAILVEDGSTVDFTITPGSGGTYTVIQGTSGPSLGTVNGVFDLHFQANNGGTPVSTDVQLGVFTGTAGTNPQGGQNYWVNGSPMADVLDVHTLFATAGAGDNVWIQNNGGADTITNTTAAQVNVAFQVASAAGQLTTAAGSGNAINVTDGTTTFYTVTPGSGTSYTVHNALTGTDSTVSGINDLHFQVSGSGNFADLPVGVSYGQGPTGPGQTGHFYWINGSSFADTINVAALFPTATAADNVWVQGDGGADTITNGTGAQVAVGFQVANTVTALHTAAGSGGTILVEDGSDNTLYTITHTSGTTYTVSDGTTTTTVTGATNLHFQVPGSPGNPPTVFTDVQLGFSAGSGGTNPQGGHFYWVNGSQVSDSIDVHTLFSTAGAGDNVWIQNNGGADTITNTTAAQVNVAFQVVSAAAQLHTATGSGNTINVTDGTTTFYTVTPGSGSSYTVHNAIAGTDSTVSGINDLHFQVSGSGNFADLQVGVSYGQGPTGPGQTGHFYWINGSSFADSINVATLLPAATAGDNVWVQGDGGADTITNTTGAQVAVGFQVANTVTALHTAAGSGGTILVEDGSGNTLYTVTHTSGTTYTVSDGTTTTTVTGATNLHFQVPGSPGNPPTIFTDVQLGMTSGSGGANPQGGHNYWVSGSQVSDSIDVHTLFSTAAAGDNVWIQNNGGADTITNTTAAQVNVGFQVASAAGQLHTMAGGGNTINVTDGTTVFYTVTPGSGSSYTVLNALTGADSTVSGINDLHFQVSGSGNFADLPVGVSYGQGPSGPGQTGHFYWINGSSFADSINVATLLPAATAGDNVWVQGDGGADTITNTTGAQVAVGFQVANTVTALHTAAGSGGTILVEDGSGNTLDTITHTSGTTYTVSDGTTTTTVTGATNLHFQVPGSPGNPPSVFTDVQLGMTYGQGPTAPGQTGHFYWVNGSQVSDSIDVHTLFSTAGAGDNVWIQNDGGADTITNTTAAQVNVAFQVASAAAQLHTAAGSGNTINVTDGTTTFYTVTPGSGSSYTVHNALTGTDSTVSGVNDLHFQVAPSGSNPPSNFADLQVGVTYGQGPTAPGQTGHFYWINGSSFADSINVATLLPAATAGDNVWVQGDGGADTITNATGAQMAVGFQVANTVAALSTAAGSGGTILVKDGSGNTLYTVTHTSGTTYTVSDGTSTTTVTGATNLHFQVPGSPGNPPSVFTDVQLGFTAGSGGTTPQGGHNYWVNGSQVSDSIDVHTMFSTAGAGDNVWIQNNGGADTITNTTAAQVNVGFQVASAAGQLHTAAGSGGAINVTDGTTTFYTVTPGSGSSYTVHNVAAGTDSTVSGVNDLHFQVQPAPGNTTPPSNFTDLQVGVTYGQGPTAPGQTGHFDWINGSSFADTINVAALFPTATASDNVWVQGDGGADTITNTTAAQVTAGFQAANTVTALSTVPGSTSGTFLVKDGSGNTLYTIASTSTAGTFTVTDAQAVVTTVSGISQLQFDVQPTGTNPPTVFTHVQLGMTAGTGMPNGMGGLNYWVDGSQISDVIDVHTLFANAGAHDTVYIQNDGGADTITNTTAAQVTVGFQATTSAQLTTAPGSGNTINVTDGTTTFYTITPNGGGSYTVHNVATGVNSTASGITTLQFSVPNTGNPMSDFTNLQVAITSGQQSGITAPQGGNFYYINGSAFAETVNVANYFPLATANDIVTVSGNGGNDTINGSVNGSPIVASGVQASVNVNFDLKTVSGPLTKQFNSDGSVDIVVSGTTTPLFHVTANASGGATVYTVADERNGGTGPLGTETVSNVNSLNFFASQNPADGNVNLSTLFNVTPNGNGGVVNGTSFNDVIDTGTLFPSATTDRVNINGGAGNDVMTGHDGLHSTGSTWYRYSTGSQGNDTINDFTYIASGSNVAKDMLDIAPGVTATINTAGNLVTLGGAGSGSIAITFAPTTGNITALTSAQIATWLMGSKMGNDTLSAVGVAQVGTGGFFLVAQNNPGTPELMISSGATDFMAGGSGADFFAYTPAAFATGSSHTIGNFSESKGDRIVAPIGTTWSAATSGSDTVITFNGNSAETVKLKGVALSSLDGQEVVVASLVQGTSGYGDVISGSGTGPSFIQAGNSMTGVPQVVVGGQDGDILVGGNGPDFYAFAGSATVGSESIANFNAMKGDQILLGVGTSVASATASNGSVVITLTDTATHTQSLGTLTLYGAGSQLSQISGPGIATWLQGTSAGGDTISAAGVLQAGTGGYALMAINQLGSTETLVAASTATTLLSGNSAAGAVVYDFSTVASGQADKVVGFNAGKGDTIHLASGETYTHAPATGTGDSLLTVTVTGGGTSTILLAGVNDASFQAGWVH
jgi:hypothetical protein